MGEQVAANPVVPEEQAVIREKRPPPKTPRDATFDIVKGIGITEVILHHVLSHSARKFSVSGSAEWWALMLTNRVLHFAVPTFLLASALLLARSLASKPKPDWKRFYARRAERSLWPYLVWSLLYIGFRIRFLRVGSDIYPTPVELPFAGVVTLPAILAEGGAWRSNLLWGKSYYHLYFLTVLLQLSLLFPLIYLAMRRWKLGFGGVLLLSAVLQWAAFVLHARVLQPLLGFTTPASSLLWYLPPVLIGIWLGLHWQEWEAVWRRWRAACIAATLVGFGLYLTLSIRQLLNLPITSFSYNAAYALFASGVALLALAFARFLARGGGWLGRGLQRIGDWSLPLFLAHPMLIFFLSGPRIERALAALPLTIFWIGLSVFALSWGFSWLTAALRLDRLLFGRSLRARGE